MLFALPLLLLAGHPMTVEYARANTEGHERIRADLVDRGAFRGAAELISQGMRLPRPVLVTFRECPDDRAYWTRSESAIVICYGYFDFVHRVVGAPRVDGVITFTLLHEVGHALINDLELPVLGREEDAADRYAAVFALAVGTDVTLSALASAAEFFDGLGKTSVPSFWDEHSTGSQRFYDLMCQLYGASPQTYARYFSPGVLPGPRAERCRAEYVQALDGWNLLLRPYTAVRGGRAFDHHVPTNAPPGLTVRRDLPPPPPMPPPAAAGPPPPMPMPADIAPPPPPPRAKR